MSAFFSFFTNPAFLPGLLVAGAPVLIHLLSKRKAREVAFPTLRFLQLTAERTASRRRLEEILLLLLRTGAMICLALALAHPVIDSGLSSGGVAAAIVLDNSLSMQQEAGGRSAFVQAKEAARDTVTSLPAGSRASLWYLNSQREDDPLRQSRSRERKELLPVIASLSPTSAGGDLLPSLLAASAALEKETLAHRELYILTDRQLSAWRNLTKSLAQRSPVRNLKIFIFSPAGTGGSNMTIERLSLRARAPLPGQPATIETMIRNYSGRPGRTTTALYVNNQLASRQSMQVPASGVTTARFNLPFTRAGWVRIRVQKERDRLAPDDHRFLTIKIRDALRVLLVEDPVSVLKRSQAGFYVASAINPTGGSSVILESVNSSALSGKDLRRYDAVFLIECPAANQTVGQLKSFTAQGGTLVLMAGENSADWNTNLGAARLLPATIGERYAGATLMPGERGHHLLASFATIAHQSLARSRVKQAYRLSLPPNSPAGVAIYAGKNPFIVDRHFGKGRIILWAAPPRPDWTNIQARPMFVPLIYAHAYAGVGVKDRQGVEAGSALPLKEDPQQVLLPSGSAVPAGDFADTWQDGIYTIKYTSRQEELIAVNPSSEEGDLTTIAPQLLLSRLRRLGKVYSAESLTQLAEVREQARQGIDLQNPLLLAVLLLLVAEAFYGASRAKHAGV